MDRADPLFDSQLTAERFLLELLADPVLPVPRAPMAAIGGETAVRLGLKYPTLFPVVAGWDCAFDFHDWYGRGTKLDDLFERREQARQHTACLQVRQHEYPPFIWFGCPLDSEQYRGNDRLHEKLNAVGVSHEYVIAENCPVAAMLDFVSNGLEKRSRRLL